MNKEGEISMSKIPEIERGSFWHPYKYSPEALKMRDEILKKKSPEIWTFFLIFLNFLTN